MRRSLYFALRACGGVFVAVVGAQLLLMDAAAQTKTNVNVLPAYINPADPEAYLKGDQYMQRQVEPTYMVSTRNPDHHMVFFNDYRAVDIVAGDVGLGEQRGIVQIAVEWLQRLFRVPPTPRPTVRAAAEAFIGYSVTYDNGSTWTGGMLPGGPFDFTEASLASPIHGVQAATDPVGSSAPCGRFYVGFIGFTRGGRSYMSVARYEDRNNTDGGHDIQYLDTRVVAQGAASANGRFLDKPTLIVDPTRGASGDGCGHTVYLAYSEFDGQEKNGKFRSKIMFARSTDGGESWDHPQKINEPYTNNQSATIAVDPRENGGGAVSVMWRSFDPQGMLVARSTNGGNSFNRAVLVNNTPIVPFDQPTLTAPPPGGDPSQGYAFRSNALPSLVASHNGTLYAAWQERVSLDGCANQVPGPQCGRPAANGVPRIVLMRSTNGTTWTDVDGNVGARRAIDFGDRCEASVQPGLGPVECRPSFGQVMPKLAAGGGRLMLAYYETRDGLSGPLPGFIAGLYRRMDVRSARLDPATGRLLGTTQVSRYDIRASADGKDAGSIDDLVQHVPGVPAVNWSGKPTSASGTSPFIGDYIDLVPAVQFVRGANGRWRWATQPGDVPDRRFHTAFGDHRNLITPSFPDKSPEGDRYRFYAPPHVGGSCVNPGSRNADIMSAQIEADLVAGAPVTFKRLENISRAFPIYVSNNSLERRFYRLTITTGAAFSSFDLAQNIDVLDVDILPNASITRVVYVNVVPGATAQFRVDIVQIACPANTPNCVPGPIATPQSASVTFNVDPTNPLVTNPLVTNSELHNPLVTNPLVTNPLVTNPLITNVSRSNPLVTNPLVTNPLVTNQTVFDVIDTTWMAQNDGTVSSAYLSLINIDNYEQLKESYLFQLLIYRVGTKAGVDAACNPIAIPFDQLITTVPNPLVTNPLVTNPLVTNPLVTNPLVTNSTFFVTPAENAEQSAAAFSKHGMQLAAFKTAQVLSVRALVAPRRPDRVFITLRSYQVVANPKVIFNPAVTPPSLAVHSQAPNITKNPNGTITITFPTPSFSAPDLRVAGTPVATPDTAAPGGTILFPAGGATIENGGAIPASPADGTVGYRILFSTDSVADAGDTVVQSGALTAPIPAGAGIGIAQRAVRIPRGAAPGVYHLLLIVDDQQEVTESNEGNNVVDVPITVAIPAGGLLTFMTEPGGGTAGQPIVPAVQVLARDGTGAALPAIPIALSLPSNPSGAALANAMATTNAFGVATFNGLTLSRAGSGFALQAASGDATSALSRLFDITGVGTGTACGAPSFMVSQNAHPVHTDPYAVVTADFNGDGKADVATANNASGNVAVLLASAGVGFQAPVYYSVGDEPVGLVTGDFNGDGNLDLAVAMGGESSIAILLNDGVGGFAAGDSVPLNTDPTAVAAGDFNGDGRVDLVATYQNASSDGYAAVVLGDGAGGFGTPSLHSVGSDGPRPSAVLTADVNGDSHLDIVVALKGFGRVMILPGTGTSFGPGTAHNTGDAPVTLASGDFNGDGRIDLAVGHETDRSIVVMRGTAAGTPVVARTLTLSSAVRGIALADIDGDGSLDIASVQAEGFTSFLGNGDFGFGAPRSLDPNVEPRGIAAADFDIADGKVDFVVVNGAPADAVTFLINACIPGPRELVVTNTNDTGAGSLRNAMNVSETNSGFADLVTFAIPGTGPFTITPASPLPQITDSVIIDATTQPGYAGAPLVRVDGASGGPEGFHIRALTSLRGFSITSWTGAGVVIGAGTGSLVSRNYIGLQPDGTTISGNGTGVVVDASNNTIGGSVSSRNVISGNTSTGVQIQSAATGVTVTGNYIGTTATGLVRAANARGIRIAVGANGNTIGGTAASARNVISGNAAGMLVNSDNNQIVGNYIGTTPDGLAILFNSSGGITVHGHDNAISSNVISGNQGGGLLLSSNLGVPAQRNVVTGNLVGTNAAGTAAIGNFSIGVFITGGANNRIGGTSEADRNVISGNTLNGLNIVEPTPGMSTGNVVAGNYIGLNKAGTAAIPNFASGILIAASGNTIGGTAAGSGNVISGNGSGSPGLNAAVMLTGSTPSSTSNNFVQGNTIGLNPAGTAAIGNNGTGVMILGGNLNTIGGASPVARNLISANMGNGVLIRQSSSGDGTGSSNLVAGNYIGVDVSGTVALANGGDGVGVFATNNTIGGTAADAGNVISGNTFNGILISSGNGPASGNIVLGNRIGTNAAGTGPLGNNAKGVFAAGATNTIIGGAAAGARNIISGNFVGVHLDGNSNQLLGNFIGTNQAGSGAIPNLTGVWVTDSTGNVVGGSGGDSNVISGNTGRGVYISHESGYTAAGNSILGNFIGTSANGLAALPNDIGVEIDRVSNNVIGGTLANYISGNLRHGVFVHGQGAFLANGNQIKGNFIGVDLNETGRLSNRGLGVVIGGSVNSALIANNKIWYNDLAGVGIIRGTEADTHPLGVTLAQNSIDLNGTLGIDLNNDGVNLNDGGDADAGPNHTQNYPVLGSAIASGGTTTITGSLNSTASSPFTIRLYASPVCNADQAGAASGAANGEGRNELGTVVQSTNSDGNVSFTFSAGSLTAGSAVTATATDAAGNTSEFSACATVTTADPAAVINTNDSGPGSLRQAILNANATVGTREIITFNIPPGPRRITLNTELPPIIDPVFIDGGSQPGFDGRPVVSVDGASIGSGSGLTVDAPDSVIRGLAMINFTNGAGIRIQSSGTATLRENFLGLRPDGATAGPNKFGLFIENSPGNSIGGSGVSFRNVISGNSVDGISVTGAGATLNGIYGNYIGTNADGTATVGNGGAGVRVAVRTNIGSEVVGTGNLIAGNSAGGIVVAAGGNRTAIQGNLIGTNSSGSTTIGNGQNGVSVFAPLVEIGGDSAAKRNVISGNVTAGVWLREGSDGSSVKGNYIGTNLGGTLAVPNSGHGILILTTTGTMVGGDTAGERNVISGNVGHGVSIGANNNDVRGNYIGTDATGALDLGNTWAGVEMANSFANRIGAVGAGNLISGNDQNGVVIDRFSGANVVAANYIGVNAAGTGQVPNGVLNEFFDRTGSGVLIQGPDNTVGGAAAGAGNVISGNGTGVFISGASASRAKILGNRIGTNAAGTASIRNRWGINTSASDTVIGGTQVLERNVVSGNLLDGIVVGGTGVSATIRGNYIGTDINGTADLGNTFNGILVSGSATASIGGDRSTGAGNVIAGNNLSGIRITSAAGSTIVGNNIGTGPGGEAIGNAQSGILISGSLNVIGGEAGAYNVIGHNGGAAVEIGVVTGAVRNQILENVIFRNGFGIDLDGDSVTLNDGGDPDTGSNDLQNFPVISSASSNSTVTLVNGSLNSTPSSTFTIRFYADGGCDASGHGQGQFILGKTTVTTNSDGNASFFEVLPVPTSVGSIVSATATDSTGNTSEFSACRIVGSTEPNLAALGPLTGSRAAAFR